MKESAFNTSENFEFEALSQAENYRSALLGEFSEFLRGNVLEVGTGIGQFTGALLQRKDIARLVCIEPDAAFCEQLRQKFPRQTIVQGTVEDLEENGDWNALVSINVLEHIEQDERELKLYHERLVKNHGSLCLFVPARPEIYGTIDRDFGHFRRYTRRELREKLARAGFEIARLRYYNFAGYFAWWLNFCLLKKRHFNPAAVRFFDHFIFPLAHGFESRVCAPPIGQNLLAVATPFVAAGVRRL